MATQLHFKIDGRKALLSDGYYSADLREAFSFSKPGARYSPAYKKWLQEKALHIPEDERQGWNGKTSMISNNTINVGLLLGAEKELAKAGFKVKISKWRNKPEINLKRGFNETAPQYEYQNEAVKAMLESIPQGGGLVLAATGAGKTKTAAQFFSWLDCDCLFVVDQVDLLYQAQKDIQEWLDREGFKEKVGIVGNSKFEPGRITIATVQTLHKSKGKSKFRKWTKNIEVVLIDEIHVQMSKRNFSVVEHIYPQAVIGLTATMQLRKKQVRFQCFSICGPLIYTFPIEQGVKSGVLSQGIVLQTPVSHNQEPRRMLAVQKRDKHGKTYRAKQPVDDYTHEVVDNDNAHELVKKLVTACRKESLCVVVLVERIKHLKRIAKLLDDYDPQLFYGAISVDARKKQLKTFDAGKDDLIIANKVFTKGINLKRIDVVIDAAQRKSKNDCMQKYGRAVRLHAEKAGIYYFDLFTLAKKMEAAAKSRRSAFKSAKIPIDTLPLDAMAFGPKGLLRKADEMLTAALRKNRTRK